MIHISIHDSTDEIRSEDWNQLVEGENPFVYHEFYQALESSNCIGLRGTWRPLYFCAYQAEKLKALAVVFVKRDSFGEFIFDWAWAQAYQQHQIAYYPKLTMATPFSPVSAPKVLGDNEVIEKNLMPKIWEVYQKSSVSGFHALFVQDSEKYFFEKLQMTQRDSFQYHWESGSSLDLDDFLSTLKRSRRKNILKERRRVREQGIQVKRKMGREVNEEDVLFFFECYKRTIEKKWSNAYLNFDFFKSLISDLADHVILLVAEHSGTKVASALYLKSSHTLYGRYWGCLQDFDFLHFELCLYQGLELSYEFGLKKFEAGAQGEHKRMRGFRPVLTSSFHHLKHPQFHAAVEDFIRVEREEIQVLFQEFAKQTPFKAELW